LNADDIVAYCRDRLPAIAVPKYVEFRDELPLTVTEKIFKRALREEEVKKMKERRVPKGSLEDPGTSRTLELSAKEAGIPRPSGNRLPCGFE